MKAISKTPITDLIKALKNDADYRRSWVDNLSITFQDIFDNSVGGEIIPRSQLKEISDKSAKQFLELLLN